MLIQGEKMVLYFQSMSELQLLNDSSLPFSIYLFKAVFRVIEEVPIDLEIFELSA